MAYKGRWRPANRERYDGDPTKIVYRSLWERQTFKYLDTHPGVVKWSSESVVVPYKSPTDGRVHRYFVDLKIQYTNGKTVLVEIKPDKQTRPPKKPARKTARFIREVMTYSVNASKWTYAESYAADRGWVFEVWTEKTLAEKGIKILNPSKYRNNGKTGIRKNPRRRRPKRKARAVNPAG